MWSRPRRSVNLSSGPAASTAVISNRDLRRPEASSRSRTIPLCTTEGPPAPLQPRSAAMARSRAWASAASACSPSSPSPSRMISLTSTLKATASGRGHPRSPTGATTALCRSSAPRASMAAPERARWPGATPAASLSLTQTGVGRGLAPSFAPSSALGTILARTEPPEPRPGAMARIRQGEAKPAAAHTSTPSSPPPSTGTSAAASIPSDGRASLDSLITRASAGRIASSSGASAAARAPPGTGLAASGPRTTSSVPSRIMAVPSWAGAPPTSRDLTANLTICLFLSTQSGKLCPTVRSPT
mmetsp:Transcript_6636/g.22861  ORF Transcript_6636/g.22861 Transcript_6636/m.22861 type:complete len:301 (-) Transcript_6636:593-1495(-)